MSDFISLPAIPFETIDVTGKIEKAQRSLKSGKLSHSGGNSPQLREACSELESLFIFYLLKEMRATIPKTGLISGGRAEEIYTSMLDSQISKISKEMASQRGIGLSSLILDRLESRPGEVEEKDIKKNE
ncbi:MAG: rod-binding protein [Deltaproteobacteria bacterium]|nr:rod-binding protein [Deltaproteobacteria bacterium]